MDWKFNNVQLHINITHKGTHLPSVFIICSGRQARPGLARTTVQV